MNLVARVDRVEIKVVLTDATGGNRQQVREIVSRIMVPLLDEGVPVDVREVWDDD
jgi:hypothetical protein